MPTQGTTFSYQHVKQGPCLAKELLFDMYVTARIATIAEQIFAPILVIVNLVGSSKQISPYMPDRKPCAPTWLTVGHYFNTSTGYDKPLEN